jgi:hypothetical protein
MNGGSGGAPTRGELADFGARWACKLKSIWRTAMRGALLWLLGIPIPIIILLYLFNVI